uniref:Core-binding (CB) domain-containing protein n=1 Tax=uncultured prokaryote TaxID=198431 RepID=A0A0H5PY44_9ZZZZ|nr:hypothetical protein [uncultured prokaryote]
MRTTLTLNQIVQQWISETDALPTTRKDYRRKISLWFRWLKARGIDPRQPSRSDVINYKNYLLDASKSHFTVAPQTGQRIGQIKQPETEEKRQRLLERFAHTEVKKDNNE